LRTANANILPFDWRATLREFQATIAEYQEAAGDRFDLSPSAKAAQELLDALSAFYGDAEAGKLDVGKANTVIQDLARILVPINFCREPRFRHDPAITVPPLPTIHTATELDQHADTLGFALNQLLRGQNRLVAALRQAQRHIALVTG
ncbi:MAG: peptidase M28, partial [Pseudomonadota bacterium]